MSIYVRWTRIQRGCLTLHLPGCTWGKHHKLDPLRRWYWTYFNCCTGRTAGKRLMLMSFGLSPCAHKDKACLKGGHGYSQGALQCQSSDMNVHSMCVLGFTMRVNKVEVLSSIKKPASFLKPELALLCSPLSLLPLDIMWSTHCNETSVGYSAWQCDLWLHRC